MVEKDHPRLSVAAQCRLPSIPRSTYDHRPAGETVENLALMARIDRQFMETPFYGVRQMTWHLRNEGHAVNPERVRRLMRPVGLMPIYRRPNTSRPAKGRQPFPYLLQGPTIDRPNQVWCADIAYLPMRRGFLHLVAIMDWHSRRVLSWRLSNTLEAEFRVEALDEAIRSHGPPEIMNADQGSQFTAFAWTDRLRRAGARICMDGKGRFLDTISIERLWRSLEYECVYLHAWETGSEARAGLQIRFEFYNHRRPRAAPDGRPPDAVYRAGTTITQPDRETRRASLETARSCPMRGEQLSPDAQQIPSRRLQRTVCVKVVVERGRPDPAQLGADRWDRPLAIGHEVLRVTKLVNRHHPGAPAAAAAGAGGGQPLADPLADHVALHLGEGGLDLQERAALRRGRVHGRVERAEAHLPRGQRVDQRHELAREPAQPVEVEHHEDVARAQPVEAGGEPGPAIRAARARGAVLEHPRAARRGQRVDLAVHDLPALGGGNVRVSDQRHGVGPFHFRIGLRQTPADPFNPQTVSCRVVVWRKRAIGGGACPRG